MTVAGWIIGPIMGLADRHDAFSLDDTTFAEDAGNWFVFNGTSYLPSNLTAKLCVDGEFELLR